MDLKQFSNHDWHRFQGCQSADDGRVPMISAETVTVTDFPAKYIETITTPQWDSDGSMLLDWTLWLDTPIVTVVVDYTGIGMCFGPCDSEWMMIECSYDDALLIAQSIGTSLTLKALLLMGFKLINWNVQAVNREIVSAENWLMHMLTKKEVTVTLSVVVTRTLKLEDIHPDADPTEVAANGLRSVLGHHGYDVYGDICKFDI